MHPSGRAGEPRCVIQYAACVLQSRRMRGWEKWGRCKVLCCVAHPTHMWCCTARANLLKVLIRMLGASTVPSSTAERSRPPLRSAVIACLVSLVQALHRRAMRGGAAAPDAPPSAAAPTSHGQPDVARRRQVSVSVLSLCHALFAQSKALVERESDVADGVRLLSAVLPLLARAAEHTASESNPPSSLPGNRGSSHDAGLGGGQGGGGGSGGGVDADAHGAVRDTRSSAAINITEADHGSITHVDTVVRECLSVLAEAVHAHAERYHGNRTVISLIDLTVRALADCVPIDVPPATSRHRLPVLLKVVLPRLAADWVLGTSLSGLRSTLRR